LIPLKDDNPTRITPFVTVVLILINVAVFVWEMTLPPEALKSVVRTMGVTPYSLTHLPSDAHGLLNGGLSLFTAMFLHGSIPHAAFNMLYLWIFGNNIEDRLGHFRFVLFYLLCGTAAALAQSLANTHSEVPMIGASGAIAGVLGAYLVLFPRAHVLVLVPLGFFTQLMRLPALWVLGFWFVLQLFQGGLMARGEEGGVAYLAHIGGFVAGLVLIFALGGRSPGPAPWPPRRGPWS
jgi:membrane associated rhomboid family serine protease